MVKQSWHFVNEKIAYKQYIVYDSFLLKLIYVYMQEKKNTGNKYIKLLTVFSLGWWWDFD